MKTTIKANGSPAKPDFTWLRSRLNKEINRLTFNNRLSKLKRGRKREEIIK